MLTGFKDRLLLEISSALDDARKKTSLYPPDMPRLLNKSPYAEDIKAWTGCELPLLHFFMYNTNM